MRIRIFNLASGLHAEAMSALSQDPFIQEICSLLYGADPDISVELCGAPGIPDQVGDDGLDVIYIRTGGTEGAFKAAFTAPDGTLALPEAPVLLLTSGRSNSLAASMEILSFLRQRGHAGEILHGSTVYIAWRILMRAAGPDEGCRCHGHEGHEGECCHGHESHEGECCHGSGEKKGGCCHHHDGQEGGGHHCCHRREAGRVPFDAAAWKPRLQGKRLGIVGKPSDWLISSDVDPAVAKDGLGLELTDIPMAELLAEIRSGEPAPSLDTPLPDGRILAELLPGGGPVTGAFQPRFGHTLTPEAFDGALGIYGALCRLVERYRLDGLTLRCFDLLTEVGNTGCMALSLLNARGIPSSCEGDVPALISMLVARELSGCCGFQANPARIDPESGGILLAHCTIPLDMILHGEYDTHFESGIGVAVRGEMAEGPVTLLKIAPDLKQCFAADAVLVANAAERELCRTQVILYAPGTARYFLTDSIGNHHIILPGHHAREI